MRKFLGYVFNRNSLVLYVAGLLFVVIGEAGPTPGALEILGYTLIVTTLVASVLNFSFQSVIEDRFSIIKGTEGAGIRRVFADREAALPRIEAEVQRATRCVDLLCIAGTSFLHPKASVLREIGRRRQDGTNTHVRVLLLDPRSRFAIERSLREEGEEVPPSNPAQFDYPRKRLCKDTLLALDQLERVLAQPATSATSGFDLAVRLYNAAPAVMYLDLDDAVFAEQYHSGIPSGQLANMFTKCLGKAVPLIETFGDSELAHVLASHFEYLWIKSADRELKVGSVAQIESSLRHMDWLGLFVAWDHIEEQLLASP